MEDLLELYARPLSPDEPVVCFDARPVQLLEWVRPASTIHLVLDNLSTHSCRALEVRYGVRAGCRLWRRFTVHFTPVHGIWLNQAEVEIWLLSRQCLGKRRIPTLDKLDQETAAWERWANRQRLRIRWRFTIPKARVRFGYDPPNFSRSED